MEKVISSLKNEKRNISAYSIAAKKHIKNLITPLSSHLINPCLMTGCFLRFSENLLEFLKYLRQATQPTLITTNPFLYCLFGVNFLRNFYLINSTAIWTISHVGFHKNMSISDAVTDCLQYVYDSIDDGHTVVSVFPDYTTAFVFVDHSISKWKLYAYGVRGDAIK